MTKKKEVKGEKVGIYVRVSTEEQAKEGISIDAQIERCKAFCKSRGWKVFRIYTDAGFSAGSLKRPALKNLLDDIESKKFNILLFYKIDRLSRNLKDLLYMLDDLKNKGINFTSVTEQIDTTTAMGTAFFQILHRAPMGYTYRNKKLVVNDEDAEKVKEIFNMWASGVHYKEISEKFKLPVSTLYEIIKNPIYIGKIRYREQLYKAAHQPIIDEELFNKVNKNSLKK